MDAPPDTPDAALFAQIRLCLPDWRPSVIFDVGANVGQSALAYAALFPEARIHAFEPLPATFEALREATAACPQVTCHRLALSSGPGRLVMTANGTLTGNHVIRPGTRIPGPTATVPARAGHGVARELGVNRISFLKIDAEGHDYDVLLGFAPVLRQVDFVTVEAAMNPYNRTHAPFRPMEDLLRHHGFLLFAIADQAMEFKRGGRPVLRRANPVFINGGLVDLNGIT